MRVRAQTVIARCAMVLCLLGAGALALEPAGAAARSARVGAAGDATELDLVAQTATVSPGGTFELQVDTGRVPPDGSIRLVLHDRVRSRSELTASTEGIGLRRELHEVATTIAELPTAPGGARRLSISFDPDVAGGVRLSASGAYPLEVLGQDASGATVASLITHVVAEPAPDDESPPLSVGVLAQLGAPPALQPDGDIALDRESLDGQLALARALTAVPEVDATLAVVPETLDALAGSGSDDDLALLEAFEAAAVGRSVLALPYVDISPDGLAEVGLAEQISEQLERGQLLLDDVLGVEPDDATWVAGPELGEAGLAAMEELGFRHAVVDADQVEPLSPGALRLSLAQPFRLTPPGERADPSGVEALAIDPRIEARLDDDAGTPALQAHRLLAELAVLWLEQPAVERSVVVPVDDDLPADALRVLLQGLQQGRIFEATGLSDLFRRADPLVDAGRTPVDRALDPVPSSGITRAHAAAVASGWDRLDTFRTLVSDDSPRTVPVVDHLLLATADDLDRDERRAHLAAAVEAIEDVTGAISLGDRATVTLTAREGTVPLTLRNDSGVPVDVVIRLRSSKLDFPAGESIAITLDEPVTRRDLDVRARASGAFPLDVEITTPDGALTLATTRYTVQSTAVAGVGLALSIGAGLFLVVWWARHWRKTRRSAKLVASHPAAQQ